MPDRSTADTAGTAETAGTAAASDITRQVDALLDRSTDGIVMDSRDRRAVVLSRQTVYQGAVFDVEDMRIALPAGGGDCVTVRRQVCRHAPCVVMLVHDEARDLYLLEREYRVGSDLFAYGLPAGLMDDGEDGVIFDHVGAFYSSEGMSDELANIMVMHLRRWESRPRRFDPDEHVESAWVTWRQLAGVPVTASNSVIAIQHEKIQRILKK